MKTNKASTDFSRKLKENVKVAKLNSNWEDEYMFFSDYLEECKEAAERAGMKKGLEKGLESARNMLNDNLPEEKVSEYSGLSLDEVRKLALEIM